MNKTQYLFVYGTLKKDTGNEMYNHLAKNSKFVGEATWKGKLYMVDYYPGAVLLENPRDAVHGELYSLTNPDVILPILDEYEECSDKFPEPKLFKRIKDKVYLKNNRCLDSWIYIYNLPVTKLKQIASGTFYEKRHSAPSAGNRAS